MCYFIICMHRHLDAHRGFMLDFSGPENSTQPNTLIIAPEGELLSGAVWAVWVNSLLPFA